MEENSVHDTLVGLITLLMAKEIVTFEELKMYKEAAAMKREEEEKKAYAKLGPLGEILLKAMNEDIKK